jgi:hypothetical protein
MGVQTGLAALACILTVTACGGSSKPKAKSHTNPFVAFSKCMRAHGVTNFPDPSGGGGIHITGSVDTRSPVFESAQTTCFKLMPGGGPLNHHASAHQIAEARQTSQCMREHGVTGFPDPIVSNQPPTSLNPANYSTVSDRGGIIIAIPRSIDPRSPAFVSAAKACSFSG